MMADRFIVSDIFICFISGALQVLNNTSTTSARLAIHQQNHHQFFATVKRTSTSATTTIHATRNLTTLTSWPLWLRYHGAHNSNPITRTPINLTTSKDLVDKYLTSTTISPVIKSNANHSFDELIPSRRRYRLASSVEKNMTPFGPSQTRNRRG